MTARRINDIESINVDAQIFSAWSEWEFHFKYIMFDKDASITHAYLGDSKVDILGGIPREWIEDIEADISLHHRNYTAKPDIDDDDRWKYTQRYITTGEIY